MNMVTGSLVLHPKWSWQSGGFDRGVTELHCLHPLLLQNWPFLVYVYREFVNANSYQLYIALNRNIKHESIHLAYKAALSISLEKLPRWND